MNVVLENIDKNLAQDACSIREPGLFEVILHNDDFTPMEFVIETLENYFFMDSKKAHQVMLEAHTKGRAVCGTYSREVAETRIDQVSLHARMQEHPLRLSMEELSFF